MKVLRPAMYAAGMYGGLVALLMALLAWGPHSRGVLGFGLALLLGSQALMSFGTLLRLLNRGDGDR